jgi:hypothetical protein
MHPSKRPTTASGIWYPKPIHFVVEIHVFVFCLINTDLYITNNTFIYKSVRWHVFCYCISKTKNEFEQNPEKNIIWTGSGLYTDIWTSSLTKTDRENINVKYNTSLYYTLRFYFPYLSLLAQPVNILVYWPGPINIMFFFRFLSELIFCLRYTITKTCHVTDLHVLSII